MGYLLNKRLIVIKSIFDKSCRVVGRVNDAFEQVRVFLQKLGALNARARHSEFPGSPNANYNQEISATKMSQGLPFPTNVIFPSRLVFPTNVVFPTAGSRVLELPKLRRGSPRC